MYVHCQGQHVVAACLHGATANAASTSALADPSTWSSTRVLILGQTQLPPAVLTAISVAARSLLWFDAGSCQIDVSTWLQQAFNLVVLVARKKLEVRRVPQDMENFHLLLILGCM